LFVVSENKIPWRQDQSYLVSNKQGYINVRTPIKWGGWKIRVGVFITEKEASVMFECDGDTITDY
jgi:hypothetical protein